MHHTNNITENTENSAENIRTRHRQSTHR